MAQATLSCPFGAIHLEMRQGGAFDEHVAYGRAHRRLSLPPLALRAISP